MHWILPVHDKRSIKIEKKHLENFIATEHCHNIQVPHQWALKNKIVIGVVVIELRW